jgi:PTH1 family peptidyl-tRNA hydrolase
MLLFVGLGNPGTEYARNRHNIGFMAVDAIARRQGFPRWRRRFQGVAAEGQLGGKQAVLLLPGTYMNESGRAVREAAQFFKIAPHEIVVFHDEVELPPGEVRVRTGGGNAGHNGLRSISAQIGNDYRRVRLGVGHPGKDLVHDYALSNFFESERPWVEALCETIADQAELLARGEDTVFEDTVYLTMNSKHLVKLRPPARPKKPRD